MKKHYHITISARDGGCLIPEESLQRDDFLIGVFAANKTRVTMKGSGGSSSRKEYVIYSDCTKAKAFADDLVSRFIDYRTLSLLGSMNVGKDDLEIKIKEIEDTTEALEQTMMEMMARSCLAIGAPLFPGPFSTGFN